MDLQSGDRVLGAFGQSQINQAAQMGRNDNALLRMLGKGRAPVDEEMRAAKIEALKRSNRPKPPKGADEGGPMLDPDALISAARRYHETGEMVPAGVGKAGTAIRAAVLNKAAEMYPDDSVGGNRADYKADAKSLADAQGSFDAVTTFEHTALKNLDLMTKLAKKVAGLGSSWLNKPLRAFMSGMGSEDQVAFTTALNAVRPEFAKILGGSVKSAAGMSDSAREEMKHLMGDEMTIPQLLAAAEVLKQDAKHRETTATETLANIRKRLRGTKGGPAKEPEHGEPRPSGDIDTTHPDGWDDAAEKRLQELEAKAKARADK